MRGRLFVAIIASGALAVACADLLTLDSISYDPVDAGIDARIDATFDAVADTSAVRDAGSADASSDDAALDAAPAFVCPPMLAPPIDAGRVVDLVVGQPVDDFARYDTGLYWTNAVDPAAQQTQNLASCTFSGASCGSPNLSLARSALLSLQIDPTGTAYFGVPSNSSPRLSFGTCGLPGCPSYNPVALNVDNGSYTNLSLDTLILVAPALFVHGHNYEDAATPYDGILYRYDVDAGTTTIASTGEQGAVKIGAIASDGTTLYWAPSDEKNSNSQLYSMPVAADAGSPFRTTLGGKVVKALAAFGGTVYVATGAVIESFPASLNAAPTVVTNKENDVTSLAIDPSGTILYWTDSASGVGRVRTRSIGDDSHASITLACEPLPLTNVKVIGNQIFWSYVDSDGGGIQMLAP